MSFPIDRCIIVTRVRLREDVAECRPENLSSLPSDVHDFVEFIEHKVRVKRRNGPVEPGSSPRQLIPTRKIKVGKGTPIVITATKDPTWQIQSIEFTPSILVYGHNGRVLDETEFHWAASYLVEMVSPMLANPADWIHLVPGLAAQNRAYWKELEIPFQIVDDGTLLRALTNSKHQNIDLPPLLRREGQTVEFADSDNHLRIRGYRKDLQMLKKRKARIVDAPQVLRIEVILKGERLRQFMAHARWQKIDGVDRLLRFTADDLKLAFSNVVGRFKGPIVNDVEEFPDQMVDTLEDQERPAESRKRNTPPSLPDYLAWISRETGLSFDDLYAPIPIHKPSDSTEDESKRKSSYRRKMISVLRQLGPISLANLLNDDAWNNQPAVIPEKTEDFRLAQNDWMDLRQEIVEAYSRKTLRGEMVD